ncbi:MAG: chorismate synthase [Tissierellales bacterium]|nr:chorismate synthase [Tissierellales bacterium]MBN2828181.1 chorismate synthase [Tissierellales bacterium]
MRCLSAGESHGKGLTCIIEGFPSNVEINLDEINGELARRQKGYGRGKRMIIETDAVEVFSGMRFGKTMGSPIALFIKNKDWENWKISMSCCNIFHDPDVAITAPRPGHADLPGAIKYNQDDVRNILERASARETATRTVVGALSKQFLKYFNIEVHHRVVSIGGIEDMSVIEKGEHYWDRIRASEVSMYDGDIENKVKQLIDKTKLDGDTLGGVVEVMIYNVPVGLGSYVHYDRKLSARLAMEIMSIQAVKGFELGAGFKTSQISGSKVHDEIFYQDGYHHKTNNAGGIEGGMSNGETIQFRAAVKPIPTLMKALKTVDIGTKEVVDACKERSDICAVPAAGVVMENVAAWVIAQEMVNKFGGDSIEEIMANYNHYMTYVQER